MCEPHGHGRWRRSRRSRGFNQRRQPRRQVLDIEQQPPRQVIAQRAAGVDRRPRARVIAAVVKSKRVHQEESFAREPRQPGSRLSHERFRYLDSPGVGLVAVAAIFIAQDARRSGRSSVERFVVADREFGARRQIDPTEQIEMADGVADGAIVKRRPTARLPVLHFIKHFPFARLLIARFLEVLGREMNGRGNLGIARSRHAKDQIRDPFNDRRPIAQLVQIKRARVELGRAGANLEHLAAAAFHNNIVVH